MNILTPDPLYNISHMRKSVSSGYQNTLWVEKQGAAEFFNKL